MLNYSKADIYKIVCSAGYKRTDKRLSACLLDADGLHINTRATFGSASEPFGNLRQLARYGITESVLRFPFDFCLIQGYSGYHHWSSFKYCYHPL